MNELSKLAGQIKGLPFQDVLTRQLNQYKTIREQLQSSVTSLREATSQAEGLRVILGRTDLLADSQSKKLASIRRRVQDLQKLLKKPSPESGELSKHLQPIKDAAKELTQEVQQEWAKTCNLDLSKAEAFRNLANRFDLEAQKKLDKVINSLRLSATRPPVTADDLRAISELRRSLQDTINSLKMEGPVAVFLLDAIQGKGDPKALTNPEIRAYLDGHQVLWQSLRVLLK